MLLGSEKVVLLCLSCCLLICSAEDLVLLHGEGSGEAEVEDWGSGSSILHLLHSFPADSPLVSETPGKPANCTQRFVLPFGPSACGDNAVGAEEFTQSRLLMLQNRATLQALSDSSGVQEGGPSYELQAKDEVQGVHADHQSAAETMLTVEKVFVSLEEKRREGKEQEVLTSMKKHLINTRSAIDRRLTVASALESQFAALEQNMMGMQLRILKLIH